MYRIKSQEPLKEQNKKLMKRRKILRTIKPQPEERDFVTIFRSKR